MSEDVNVRLEERKKALESEFAKLEEERKKLVDQRSQLDQRLAQIGARQLQVKGAHQEVLNLLGEKKPVPVEAEAVSEDKPEEK